MAEEKNQLKNTLTYIKQTLVTTAIPFLALLIIARFVSPEDFGQYALSQVYAIIVTFVFSLGLHVGYERNYFKYSNNHRALCALHGTILLVVGSLFMLTIVVSFFYVDKLMSLVGVHSERLFMIVLLGQSLERLSQFYFIYFRNMEDATSYTRYMVLVAALNGGLSISLVLFMDMGITGVALGYTLAWGIILLIMAAKLSQQLRAQLDWSIFKEAAIISIPVTPSALTKVMGSQSDKYILGVLNTTGDVGIYSLANRIGTVINSYMIALQNAYTPVLYRAMFSKDERLSREFSQQLTMITFLSILPAVVLSLFAKEITWLLLPESYQAVSSVLVIISIYYGINYFGKISGKQLTYAKKTGLTSFLSIVFSLINIVLNIPLINEFGVLGAALATLLTGAMYTAVGFWIAQKYHWIKWEYSFVIGIIGFLLASGLLSLGALSANLSYGFDFSIRLAFLLAFIGYGIKLDVISLAKLAKIRIVIQD
ncbi:MAG: oligosaccharide flippase family protein [Pseudomonadales bacterium]